MRAKLLLVVVLLGSTAASVRAHQIYTEDCSTDIKDVFQTTDTVCVQGDVDYTCPEGMIDLPGANVYVVPRGGANFTGPPTHFTTMGGFGSFMQITVRTPPLTPGVYDLVLDEHCDGVFDGDDLRVDSAFTVGGGGTCPDAAPGAQRRDPGIPSGAKCRGACGGDCPATCTAASLGSVCVDGPSCTHTDCSYTGSSCGSHAGCRTHDDCYDACATAPLPAMCRRGCDQDCLAAYGLICFSWMVGHGPYDSTINFSDPPSASGPSAGSCSGGC